MDDAELVLAFREGDLAAFATLIERHRARTVNVVRAMTGDPAMAEDVAQEATYQAYFEIERLRDPGRFGSWLCGIAVNLAKMALRRRRFEQTLDDVDGGRYVPDAEKRLRDDDPELAYEALELHEAVQRALQVLSLEMRMAVWLHYVEGMSYQEVSVLTGIPAGRLRVLSHRARQRLREELAEAWRPKLEKRSDPMVEVSLHDIKVMMRDGDGETPFLRWVMVLKAKAEEKALCIWVGPYEGESLAMQMADMSPSRPGSYSLMGNLMETLEAKVERVEITDLVDATFMARIHLAASDNAYELDARPSDAVNLAVRTEAPIFVSDAVWQRVAFDIGEDIPAAVRSHAETLFGQAQQEGFDWRSGIEHMKESFQRREEEAERIRTEMQRRHDEGDA